MFSDMTFKNSVMFNNKATKTTRGIFSGFSKIVIKDSYFANKEIKSQEEMT